MKRYLSFVLVMAVAVLFVVKAGYAKGDKEAFKTPEELFAKYSESFSAYASAGKELVFSRFMHPEALKMFKEGMIVDIDGKRQLSPVIAMGMSFEDKKLDEKNIINLNDEEFYDNISGLMRGQEKELYKYFKIQYLGVVNESDNVRHIVYNTGVEYDKYKYKKVSIITVKKYKDGWLMMLPPETEERMFMMNLMKDATAQGSK